MTKTDLRKNAECEASKDLQKSIHQLLSDIHEETHADFRNTEANIAGALKRTASMMARVSLSNEKLSKKMNCLTKIITILTFATVVLAVIMVLIQLKIF